jgi:alpha-L-fucosidase
MRPLPLLLLLASFAACTQPPPQQDAPAGDRVQWWREARFGLFVHWGLYAIPAGEWQGRTDHGEWIRETAHIPVGEYERFQRQWNPTQFDADAWAALAARAGMQYAVLTTKHHDGFCMFQSALTDWDVGNTPSHRDVVGEYVRACRRHGLRVGFYHSIMDWHHPDYLPRRGWEKDRSAEGADFERYVAYLRGQVRELLTNYGPIDVMWFDGEWENTWTNARGKELYALCRTLQPGVLVNNRVGKSRDGMAGLSRGDDAIGDFGTPEQEVPPQGLPGVDWETCMTMNQHWGWNRADDHWKSTTELIRTLADVASKGGNFLLNVGPMADGRFPSLAIERLEQIGRWMDVHGLAIHGTRSSPFGALPFGRCTWRTNAAGSRLYLFVFDVPADRTIELTGLGNAVRDARLLGGPALPFRDAAGTLRIELPASGLDARCPVVAVDLTGEPLVYLPPTLAAAAPEFVRELAVDVQSPSSGLDLAVTTDGSEPTLRSPRPALPLLLAATTTVKARAFHRGEPVTPVVERTFAKVAPWPAADAQPKLAGLSCSVHPGTFDRLPDFAAVPAEREFDVPVPTIADDSARERVARRFTGFLRVPTDDVYQFALTADDGARLLLDGRTVVDHDGLHSASTGNGTAPLAQGLHRIEVQWFNKTGDAALALRWARLGGTLSDVAAAELLH